MSEDFKPEDKGEEKGTITVPLPKPTGFEFYSAWTVIITNAAAFVFNQVMVYTEHATKVGLHGWGHLAYTLGLGLGFPIFQFYIVVLNYGRVAMNSNPRWGWVPERVVAAVLANIAERLDRITKHVRKEP